MRKLNVYVIVSLWISFLGFCYGGELPAIVEVPKLKEIQRQVPVLIGQETIISKVKVSGQIGQRLEHFDVILDAAPENSLKVSIYYAGPDSVFMNTPAQEWSMVGDSEVKSNGLSIIPTDVVLSEKESYFYVACRLPDTWKVEDKFKLVTKHAVLNGKKQKPILEEEKTYYPAVVVRRHMQDNVHTSRIPGIVRTNEGTLLAIFDARYESARDLQGHMDIGLHRSEDGGQTWKPMQIAMDMGEWGGLPQKFNGVSDACILVDKARGTIFIAATWMYGVLDKNGKWIENLQDTSTVWNHQWRNRGSQLGLDVKQSSQFMLVSSSDDGKTWSSPLNITAMGKKNDWWLWAPAPGNGITMTDGTLVFPTQGRDHTGKPFSNITYSKDGGKTWNSSSKAIDVTGGTTECAVIELSDGQLMLNMRANKNKDNLGNDNGRAVSVSSDLGKTWQEHPTSFRDLIEPTCMASLFRHDLIDYKLKSIVFHANPNHKSKRIHMTLKSSIDDGNTWPKEQQILLDEGSSRGYSCITSVDNDHIGILYESSQADMVFQKFVLSDIIKETNQK